MNVLVRRAATTAVTAGAAIAARRAVELGWRARRGEDPPTSGGLQSDAEIRDVLLWSVVLTLSVVVAQRIATRITERLLED